MRRAIPWLWLGVFPTLSVGETTMRFQLYCCFISSDRSRGQTSRVRVPVPRQLSSPCWHAVFAGNTRCHGTSSLEISCSEVSCSETARTLCRPASGEAEQLWFHCPAASAAQRLPSPPLKPSPGDLSPGTPVVLYTFKN